MSAIIHLQRQLKDLRKHPVGGFRVEPESNVYVWTVWFVGPKETPYEGGVFKATLKFPEEFPMKPPVLTINSEFWHPNVYPSGEVCMSILHAPGTDALNSLESAAERWTPIQSIESVLLSFISLLADPDPSEAGAPANVDALVQWRKNKLAYMARARACVASSLAALPADFEPIQEETAKPKAEAEAKMFGMEESLSGVAASPSSLKFADEVGMLRSMGLGEGKTDEELDAMLKQHKGDLDTVSEMLMC